MSTISITKIKVLKEKGELNFTKTLADGKHSDDSSAPEWEIHPDLKEEIKKLRIHMATLTDHLDAGKMKDINKVDENKYDCYHANGYSISGKEGQEGVVITGYKILKSGKPLTINTPFERFEAEDGKRYLFMDELYDQLGLIEKEAIDYLNGDKKAPSPQMAMEFNEETNR